MKKSIAVLIVAAGRGTRLGGDLPKQYRTLGRHSVLHHTIEQFLNHDAIEWVQTVIHPDDRPLYDQSTNNFAILPPVLGGATRQASVFAGLQALSIHKPDVVLIHDAARPFIYGEVISRILATISQGQGVIAALKVADTIKRAGQEDISLDTVDRTALWRAQTPQGFMFDDIFTAHQEAVGLSLTDDAAVMEQAGHKVSLVEGHEDMFKITTQQDLERAQKMMSGAMEYRSGTGFDVHAFTEGDHVTLCGVQIAHSHRLSGHSDADVALHALTDAILGAIAQGDIGSHFPPSDMQWKGASSDRFLRKACDLLKEQGGRLMNVDLTIICESPKIGPHRDAMRQAIADITGIDLSRVSVKGTTTEKLGFTGRKEGIAAQATCSVALPL